MAPTPPDVFAAEPVNAQEAIRRLELHYEWLIASGQSRPWLYPWATIGFTVAILYLVVDHRRSPLLKAARYLVWAFSVWYGLWTVFNLRARNPASSLMVGVTSAWFILWSGTILVFEDPQSDYARLEKRRALQGPLDDQDKDSSDANGRQNGHATNGHLRKRARPDSNNDQTSGRSLSAFTWQPYPSSFFDRLDWVLDIYSTFRGVAWSWRSPGLPPLPISVTNNLSPDPNERTPASKAAVRAFSTRSELLRHNLYIFARDYLILDLLKTLIAHDAYFWGYPLTTRPPGYLPSFLHSSPVAIRTARLLISVSAMKFGLEFIFTLGPLLFAGLLSTTPLGARTEAWCHPDHFGTLDAVFANGLAGWWGRFWHQTFRKGFQAPGDALVRALRLAPRAAPAKLLGLAVAFALSGFVHACGSRTQVGETRPWAAFGFFAVQPVGIAVQLAAAAALGRVGVRERCPVRVRRWVSFVFAHVWMYYTAPLLVEDFSRGGVWLFEPVPLSLFRGPLGLGSAEDGVVQWYGKTVGWHRGESWWGTGLAI